MANFWKSEGFENPQDVLLPKNNIQRWVWNFVEDPHSSKGAKCFAIFSISMIIM